MFERTEDDLEFVKKCKELASYVTRLQSAEDISTYQILSLIEDLAKNQVVIAEHMAHGKGWCA
jgi:hypothetical protein